MVSSTLHAKPAGGRGERGNLVTEHLAQRVFSGELKPGDSIPTETELVDRFAISRASVRSGLQILATLGIIDRQAGRGSTVQEFREWNFLDPMVTTWIAAHADPNPDFLLQIFEFRRTTEPLISAVAATRATARDLLAMEEAYDIMANDWRRERGTAEGASFTDGDIAFHTAIYRATHNLVWAQLAHILRPSILLVIRTSNNTADELRDSLGRHRKLMESIRLRDPEAAFDATLRVMNRTGFDLGIEPTRNDDEILAHLRTRLSRADTGNHPEGPSKTSGNTAGHEKN